MTPIGYANTRWQEALDPEGETDPIQSREVQRVLRFGKSAVPMLIACLTDRQKTKTPVWDFWPETKVGDIAFSVLCDLFSDPHGRSTLAETINWATVEAESPGQAAWIAWNNYLSKHGRLYVQQNWRTAWTENKGRIYWDDAGRCFKSRSSPTSAR